MSLTLGPALGRFQPVGLQLKAAKAATAVNLGTGGSQKWEYRRANGNYDLQFTVTFGEGASDGGGLWYVDAPMVVTSGITAFGMGMLTIPGVGGLTLMPELPSNYSRILFRVPRSVSDQSLVQMQSWDGVTPGQGQVPNTPGNSLTKSGVKLTGFISIPKS